jgi:hypothetical protein
VILIISETVGEKTSGGRGIKLAALPSPYF